MKYLPIIAFIVLVVSGLAIYERGGFDNKKSSAATRSPMASVAPIGSPTSSFSPSQAPVVTSTPSVTFPKLRPPIEDD